MLEGVLIAAIAVGLYFAVAYTIRNRGKCSGCCGGCPMAGRCQEEHQERDKHREES
jgi:hypothetical protein